MANYEIVAGQRNRVMLGLITEDQRMIAYGSIQIRFAQDTGGPSQATPAITAFYLPVPGTEAGSPDAGPQAIQPSSARGVYAAYGVTFQQPGSYLVEVAADVQDVGILQGVGRIEVLEAPSVPGVGEEAPRTENHVMDDDGVPAEAIDSRATTGEIPDPELHQDRIANAIADGRPVLAIFSTPVFCVSRFCGPVTDVVQEIAREVRGDIAVVHVEVWRDFEANTVNEAAAEWLLRDDTLNEPWLFLVDERGLVAARWDNLFTEDEVRAAIDDVLVT